MKRISLTLAILAFSAQAAAADVRVVAPTGAPYTEIQNAVDAANDGDVILVKSGTYQSFVVRNQELAIVADTNAIVQVQGAIRVSGVSATRSLLISGLKATGSQASSSARHGLFARNCAGSVRLIACDFTGVPLNAGLTLNPSDQGASPFLHCYEGQGAYVESCTDVAFVGCTLNGSEAPPTSGYGGFGTRPFAAQADGGHGVYAETSQVALLDSSLSGGRAGWSGYGGSHCEPAPYAPDPYGYIGASGEGCRAKTCFVFASNCTFTGARGWDSSCLGQCMCAHPSAGGNALVQDGSSTAYQLHCVLAPGVGGLSTGGACPCGIGGNFCSPTTDGASGSTTIGPVSTLPGSACGLSATRVVREQQLVTMTFTGQPGDRVELVHSERTTFQFTLGMRGVSFIPRTRPQLVQKVGTIGPSGLLTQTFTVGELGAGVQSKLLYLQASMIDTNGQTTLSSPAVVVLLDSAF